MCHSVASASVILQRNNGERGREGGREGEREGEKERGRLEEFLMNITRAAIIGFTPTMGDRNHQDSWLPQCYQ